MTRKRIDRFIEDALSDFEQWLNAHSWHGKEHDCVNLFVHEFLSPRVGPDAAIHHPTQICIECGVRQPACFEKPAARKDVVIWRKPFQTLWNESFEPVHDPWVVMEWKAYRKRTPKATFDPHDEEWIREFSKETPKSLGYVVSVDFSQPQRAVRWKKAMAGKFSKLHL